MKKLQIKEGDKFGELTIIEELIHPKRRQFKCKCNCGKETFVFLCNLNTKHTISCGCIKGAPIGNTNKVSHGDTTNGKVSLTYNTWHAMMSRCYNKNADNYGRYGAKGIEVYGEWHKYINFKNYLIESKVGLRPSKELTLDRYPDNNKGYYPNNIRWATIEEQSKNK